jgi:hypothetical protein
MKGHRRIRREKASITRTGPAVLDPISEDCGEAEAKAKA